MLVWKEGSEKNRSEVFGVDVRGYGDAGLGGTAVHRSLAFLFISFHDKQCIE